MKMYHFALVFIVIFITVMVPADLKLDNLKTVIESKEQIDRCIDTALDDAVSGLAETDSSNTITIDKEAATESFFLSLYSNFGLQSDKEGQEKLNMYIPVVVVTMEDGYYVFYSDEFTGSDGYTYVSKRWSEKLTYTYEDNDFIYGFTLGDAVTLYDKNLILGGADSQRVYSLDYHDLQTKSEYASYRAMRPDGIMLKDETFELVRKQVIIDSVEKTMTYYTSRHNHIAEQYGITYNFSLPAMREEDWAPYLDNVSMYVVFQGYPYGSEVGEFYNRIATAGAKISKSRAYYLEQKGWYLVYHREDCPELLKESLVFLDEPLYDIHSCARAGAYACPICNGNSGMNAPNYTVGD